MNMIIVFVSLFGVAASLLAYGCAKVHAHDIQDTMFFGTSVPWAFVGVAGYLLIAATTAWPMVTRTLVLIGALTTAFLIFKAQRAGLICPGCILVWFVNVLLVVLAFTTRPQEL
jgi:uncharacterized membrane protein